MKLLLDACVMYPTVMRSVLLGAARAGCFTPIWSDRILEEWALSARKIGPTGEPQARAEIAMVKATFPAASVTDYQGLEPRLWLPDEGDIHVLAAAIRGSADGIVTMNAKDFPRNILAEEGLSRNDPDALLLGFYNQSPEALESVAHSVNSEANRLSGKAWELRALMKKARLPRFGKALTR
ncbi:MAG: PIN domain-containing protein [Paracoccaceae bacterium]|nr:PIN domain-containing protein [Paracoccaceae bacterium]MDG2259305.1 PIN domain-containing protein [Paracoccaceae bacterium]